MARRFCPVDNEHVSEPSPYSMAGIIKLQPHRKIGQDPWKPAQTSELSVACENASSTAENLERLLHVNNSPPSTFMTSSPELLRYNRSTPNFQASQGRAQHRLITEGANHFPQFLAAKGRGQASSWTEAHTSGRDRYTELFGKLPDQIRLHEELGEFDGQVVFIGHPNRDVSAHQWSSASFQWESIGRYCYSRDKVEGSLASERLKGIDPSRDALLHFKMAAEDREKDVVQITFPQEELGMVPSMFPNVVHAKGTSLSSAEATQEVIQDSVSHVSLGHSSGQTIKTTSDPSHNLVTKEQLDDPFVSKTNSVQRKHPSSTFPRFDYGEVKGSLDLRYEFPALAHALNQNIAVTTPQRQGDSNTTRDGSRLTQPSLRDIGFGEEASSGATFSDGQSNSSDKPPAHSSPEIVGVDQKPGSRMSTNAEYTELLDAPVQGRMIPRFEGSHLTARSLFPAPGLTIANPYRTVPRMETATPSVPEAPPKTPVLTQSKTDDSSPAALQFSDPDILRREVPQHVIANGLSKQAPTTQNFKGPFFTDSIPTANDPTASLFTHVSEEEKLQDWYRDGHRPARQREYATSLMSAAAAGSRSRRPGAIGDAAGIVDSNEIKNTVPFVRLYEGFSEYIEEYRNGSGGSYFTRAWKVPPADVRDLGPDGNNSFFAGAGKLSDTEHLQVASQHHEVQVKDFARMVPPSDKTRSLPFGSIGDPRRVGLVKMATRASQW
ncbi:hypothetical protein HBI55_083320 [Parastagonospora nodorum]|nr:hypothetical protein HBH47_040810 [Parastagonospora nodorum]KAH4859788.1 hypothetical protein HBH75_043260 [Parastagonospora nodorum]KAH5759522.1 hypothetical protein HBI16_191310 [Parastagonospora nodorum]KAH6497211.1 hypothetical protein HBI55_083320 [Parastagonospora nodorum]